MFLNYHYIRKYLMQGLMHIKVPKEIASIIINSVLLTEACGVTSHGVRVLPIHVKKIINGCYNMSSDTYIDVETASFTRINCNNQIGMVSATKCMQYAIDKSKECGIYTVIANNCNTYGAAFIYTMQAVEQGCIGITISNSPAQMAPIGGCSKLFGTNPLSYAIPAFRQKPIVFDMSTSVVAKSKINQAREIGAKIPEGWALDVNGEPTTDPNEAVRGLVLPMAGAKGYGLSMMIDIIAGVLSNAAFLDGVGRFYDSNRNGMNVGHVFIAIDPQRVYGPDFYEQMDKYIIKIKSSISVDNSVIRIPGERKLEMLEKSILKGMEIPDNILTEFNRLVKL